MPLATLTNIVFSAYCACRICCGPDASGITSIGTKPQQNHTIAGPRSFPLGTILSARLGETSNTYRLEDRTAKKWDGKRWDIYFRDHAAARQFGLRTGIVEILNVPAGKSIKLSAPTGLKVITR